MDNKRILEKLENKIAIDNFKEENQKVKNKNYLGVKVASFLIAGVLMGNVATYATTQENLFVWLRNLVLDNIGITAEYENEKNEVGIINEYKGITMTLTDYGIDKENLIIGYTMKLPENVKFEQKTVSSTKIKNEGDVFDISDTGKSLFYKVSDTEYIIYEIYDIDATQIKKGSVITENMKLYEYLYDVGGALIGDWNFEIPIDETKISKDYKEYNLDKKIELQEVENPYNNHKYGTDEKFLPKARITKAVTSDIATKLYLTLSDCATEPSISYTIQIIDEKGNIVLDKNQEDIVKNTVVFKKIDLDQELTINLFEQIEDNSKYIITAKSSEKINLLSCVVKESENKTINKKKFGNLEFECSVADKDISEEVYGANDSKSNTRYYMSIPIIEKDEILDNIEIVRYKNIFNDDLQTLFDKLKLLEYVGGYAYEETSTIFTEEDEYEVTQKELLDYAKNGYININGKRINLDKETIHEVKYDNIKNVKFNDVNALNWVEDYGGSTSKYLMVIDGYVYEIKCPASFTTSKYTKDFIDSLKINK